MPTTPDATRSANSDIDYLGESTVQQTVTFEELSRRSA